MKTERYNGLLVVCSCVYDLVTVAVGGFWTVSSSCEEVCISSKHQSLCVYLLPVSATLV